MFSPVQKNYRDLLFSCSKDHVINAWHSHNGERLGTYDGHNGTVWTIDVDCKFSLSLSSLFRESLARALSSTLSRLGILILSASYSMSRCYSSNFNLFGFRICRQRLETLERSNWTMSLHLGVPYGSEKGSMVRRRFKSFSRH